MWLMAFLMGVYVFLNALSDLICKTAKLFAGAEGKFRLGGKGSARLRLVLHEGSERLPRSPGDPGALATGPRGEE